MDMILIRLTPPGDALRPSQSPNPTSSALSPEIVADILWAVAVPTDALEHVRARSGPGRQIDVALFHRTGPVPADDQTCLALCQRAIATAPTLAGWTAHLLHAAQPYAAG